jgi:hypothetical protein
MTQEEFKKEWEGVLRGVSREEFAKAFVHWFERCEKCIRIDITITVYFLMTLSCIIWISPRTLL